MKCALMPSSLARRGIFPPLPRFVGLEAVHRHRLGAFGGRAPHGLVERLDPKSALAEIQNEATSFSRTPAPSARDRFRNWRRGCRPHASTATSPWWKGSGNGSSSPMRRRRRRSGRNWLRGLTRWSMMRTKRKQRRAGARRRTYSCPPLLGRGRAATSDAPRAARVVSDPRSPTPQGRRGWWLWHPAS